MKRHSKAALPFLVSSVFLALCSPVFAQGNWKIEAYYEGSVNGVLTQNGTTAYVTNTINGVNVPNGAFSLSNVANTPAQTTSGGITAKLNLRMNAHTAHNSTATAAQNGVTNGNIVFRFTWQPKNGDLLLDPAPRKVRFFYQRKLHVKASAYVDDFFMNGSTASASASVTVAGQTLSTRSIQVPPPDSDVDEPATWQDPNIIEASADITTQGVGEYRLPINWSCSASAFSPY